MGKPLLVIDNDKLTYDEAVALRRDGFDVYVPLLRNEPLIGLIRREQALMRERPNAIIWEGIEAPR